MCVYVCVCGVCMWVCACMFLYVCCVYVECVHTCLCVSLCVHMPWCTYGGRRATFRNSLIVFLLPHVFWWPSSVPGFSVHSGFHHHSFVHGAFACRVIPAAFFFIVWGFHTYIHILFDKIHPTFPFLSPPDFLPNFMCHWVSRHPLSLFSTVDVTSRLKLLLSLITATDCNLKLQAE